MRPERFRQLALALPEAVESEHMAHPDFRVGGKVFATLGYPDTGHAMVKLAPEQQAHYVRLYPETFSPAAGAWGRGGCTLILLKGAPANAVQAALASAWRSTAPKRLLTRTSTE